MTALGSSRTLARHPVIRSLLVAAFVVLFGTCGYMWVEGWGFWRSLFFTLITLTTVAYGDYGLTEHGERFTAILMIGGIGVVTFAMTQFIRAVAEYQAERERSMQRHIEKLRDHYIVCGLGRMGRSVCESLARRSAPFVVVDRKPEAVEQARRDGWCAVEGDATDDDLLQRLHVSRAKAVACTTGDDTENIVITLSARGLNPDIMIFSRAEQENAVTKIRRAGATRVVSPVREGGHSLADAILNPTLAAFLQCASGGADHPFTLMDLVIEPGSRLDGTTVRDYGTAHPSVVFVARRHASTGGYSRPKPDEPMQAGDSLIIAGSRESIDMIRVDASGPRSLAA